MGALRIAERDLVRSMCSAARGLRAVVRRSPG